MQTCNFLQYRDIALTRIEKRKCDKKKQRRIVPHRPWREGGWKNKKIRICVYDEFYWESDSRARIAVVDEREKKNRLYNLVYSKHETNCTVRTAVVYTVFGRMVGQDRGEMYIVEAAKPDEFNQYDDIYLYSWWVGANMKKKRKNKKKFQRQECISKT